MRYILFLCSLLMFLSSCSTNSSKKEAIVEYEIEDALWTSIEHTQILGGIAFKASQIPTRYFILKNLGVSNIAAVDSIANSLEKERVVVMEFRDLGDEDLLGTKFTNRTYEDAVKYMAFGIQKDVSVMTSSGKKIPCSGLTFERNFKVAPFKRILLHFGNVPPEDTIQLIYDDRLFGNGTIKFNFNELPIKL